MSRQLTLVTIGAVVLIVVAYLGAGLPAKFSRDAAFKRTNVGDSYEDVVSRFGTPSATDGAGKNFTRYTSQPCLVPCARRLWFENRVFLDVEAWSVSFDLNGRVLEKYHWVSP